MFWNQVAMLVIKMTHVQNPSEQASVKSPGKSPSEFDSPWKNKSYIATMLMEAEFYFEDRGKF